MASCPDLVPPFVIIDNILQNNSTLQATTTATTVGTQVRLSCKFNYTLVADSPYVVCQQNQNWNFTNKPTCEAPVPSTGLSDDQKIILAVAGGVGALVLIVLFIMVCLIIRARKKKDKQGASGTSSTASAQLPPDGYLGPPMDTYPQTFEYPYDEDPYKKDTYPREKPYQSQPVLPPLRHTNYDNMAFSHERDPDYRQSRRTYAPSIDRVPDRSYTAQPIPQRDYDRDDYGGPYREARTTPRHPVNEDPTRDTRATPRYFPGNGRTQYTNSVRMYEEYGRPQRVPMLEEAYGMHLDHRSVSNSFNFAQRGVPNRSIDSYQSKGGDPTRYYRGPQY